MIRKHRLKKHLTQKQLAEMIGVSQAYISRLESDQFVNITLLEIIKLSKALGLKELELAEYFLNKYKNLKFEFGSEIV